MTVAHVAVNVTDWGRAKAFYEPVLGSLGYRVVYEEAGALAYFADDRGLDFGIGRRDPVGGAHVAFDCDDRSSVDAFHAAGLAAGGTDNGAPGVRWYHENYYGAFVLDPDGNNVEAVCHKPE